jgi:hypothetical protein
MINEYDFGTDKKKLLGGLLEEVHRDHVGLEIRKNGVLLAVAIHPDDLAYLRFMAGADRVAS